jgi:hypothetical protein
MTPSAALGFMYLQTPLQGLQHDEQLTCFAPR